MSNGSTSLVSSPIDKKSAPHPLKLAIVEKLIPPEASTLTCAGTISFHFRIVCGNWLSNTITSTLASIASFNSSIVSIIQLIFLLQAVHSA